MARATQLSAHSVGRRKPVATLDDLGNVGEFIAALGVVISLLYLAFQIRQNTSQINQNTKAAQATAFDSSITNAMAAIFHTTVSGTATDQLIGLWDFVTAASSTSSTFTVQWNASGMFTLDLTP